MERTCFLSMFKRYKYRTNIKKIFLFQQGEFFFFFVSQRKNAIITRFVKYGGLEQILILISKIEV